MGASWRSGPGPERFPRRSGGRSTTGTAAAASRVAGSRWARGITSATGRKAARPRSPTSPCSVAVITARSTRRVTGSIHSPTAGSGSCGRTAGPCPRFRFQSLYPPIRCRLCERSTTAKASGSTRGLHAQAGWGSAWISAGRSMSCIRWPRERRCPHGRRPNKSRFRRSQWHGSRRPSAHGSGDQVGAERNSLRHAGRNFQK